MTIEAGNNAPDFTLATDGNDSVSLSGLKGKKIVVYFYPKDDTPGCTLESCAFRDLHPDFSNINAVVIGISKDSVESHDKFKAKFGLPFILAADPELKAIKGYGVWVEKNMYGKKSMGVERSTFLIDENGVIAKAWRKVKADGHAEAVLAAANAL
ncbi:MAG: peroxiredoxin [Rhodospirillales bacterium]|jgi:peroxiredoxin Q/BCP|nr:peroxiredoxin [Rhodospirillales bacterium]MBT4006202.1 peroxiredoxin [Rhodospirillales bacterium]MBT5075780.1 peroxiredoxin [Rhodospirillales bacterium]MBT5114383.1 peroxiredoxin [Rhodospirillales bacterium]MBT5672775.1 peroxiredoxin [Rhodospirillales bacterium]